MWNCWQIKNKRMKIKRTEFGISSGSLKAFSVACMLSWLSLLSFPGNLRAQDSLSYSDCIAVGLEQNYALKMIRNTEQIARNDYKLGMMSMMPTLGATGTLNNSVVDSRQKMFSGDIRERDDAKTSSLNANIALNWTVFDGFGMFVEYRQLRQLLEMGELTTRLTLEALMADIGTEYYNYLQHIKRLKTLQYVMDLSKERLRITEEKYRIGYQSKLDFQQAKVEYHTDSSLYLQQVQNLCNSYNVSPNALSWRSILIPS